MFGFKRRGVEPNKHISYLLKEKNDWLHEKALLKLLYDFLYCECAATFENAEDLDTHLEEVAREHGYFVDIKHGQIVHEPEENEHD